AATSQLDPSAHHVIYVATPTFGARGLYLTIVHALGARPRAQKAELIAQAQTLLAAEEHERRRRVVFIIDEAHLLAPDQLEELRHHLALVGRTDPLIADDAIARLHKASLGLPRALNNVAIAALIAAATAGKALVDDECAKKAVAELTRD